MSIRYPACILFLGLASTVLAAELPGLFAQRATAQSREEARVAVGFPPGTQAAVDRALRHLLSKQDRDGSWGDRSRIATTSLALLALLADGHSPLSEEAGEAVTGAILFLIDSASKGKGKLGEDLRNPRWPLHHALGTQALAESCLLCRSLGVNLPRLEDSVQVAAQWIIDNQHRTGGWAPAFDEEAPRGGDLGLTVPLLHGLWLAHQAGVETRNAKRAVRSGLDFIEKLQKASGAVSFAANAHRPGDPMTGGSAFIFQIAKRDDHQVTRQALTFLANESHRALDLHESPSASELLSFHYDSLAFLRHPSANRDKWFAQPVAGLLKRQRADGSFAAQSDPSREPSKDGPIQHTSLGCLILQSPWRYHLAHLNP